MRQRSFSSRFRYLVVGIALMSLALTSCSQPSREKAGGSSSQPAVRQPISSGVAQKSPSSAAPQAPTATLQPAASSTPGQQPSALAEEPSRPGLPPAQAATPVHLPARTAYLTFDDGPSANTEGILAVLRQYGVKATFFVIGVPTDNGRRLYQAIAADGHVLGNHTFTHDYSNVYRSVDTFRLDARKLDSLLEQTTGHRPELLRFPGGSNNHQARRIGGSRIMPAVASEMLREGYAYFDWNVSSTDAARAVQSREEIVSAVLSAVKGKLDAIVLLHDADKKTTTREALPDIIRGLQAQGFRFDVLHKDTHPVRFLNP